MSYALPLSALFSSSVDKQGAKKARRDRVRSARKELSPALNSTESTTMTIEAMPTELKQRIAAELVEVKGDHLDYTSAKMFELASPRLYGCAPSVRGCFFHSRSSGVEYITEHEIDNLADLVVELGMNVSCTTIDPLWWKYTSKRSGKGVVDMNVKFLSSPPARLLGQGVAAMQQLPIGVEDTQAGVRPSGVKTKMPTSVEERGVRAMRKSGATGETPSGGNSSTMTITSAISSIQASESDALVVANTNLLEGTTPVSRSLTETLMASFPDINFKNPFVMQRPDATANDLYIAWGYGLKSLPSSGRGAGYADAFSVQTWYPKLISAPSYPSVPTSVGYQNIITRARIQAMSGAAVTTERADPREFQSRFDEMKNLPTEFRNAGEAKAQDGDNHIGFLVLAMARLLALKQASENGAVARYKSSRNDVLSYGVDLEPYVSNRASVFTAAATALADAWFQDTKTVTKPGDDNNKVTIRDNIYEMLLPSNRGDANEVIYLAYLAGHLDANIVWSYRSKALEARPATMNIVSDVTSLLRIPLANALRAIKVTDVAAFDSVIELGRAEAVFNAYVRRYDLGRQIEVAQAVLMLALADRTALSANNALLGLPHPNHTVEYDLWVDVARYGPSSIALVTAAESANLLVAISQVQRTMRDDVLSAKLVSYLESKDLPVMSSQAASATSAWLSDEVSQGYATWARAYLLAHTGNDFLEVRRLGNFNSSEILVQLQAHMMVEDVRPSSLLYYGEKIQTGCLSLLWDEARRRQLTSQRNVTGTQAALLEFLFNGEPDIFAAPSTPWLSYLSDLNKRRSSRKIDSSLSVRTTNSVRGDPRIIYLGFRPDNSEYNDRMNEAQTISGLVSHYEPNFDINSAAAYVTADIVLGPKPKDLRHEGQRGRTTGKAPVKGARSRSSSLTDMIKEGVVAAGRLYTHAKPLFSPPKQPTIPPPRADRSYSTVAMGREMFSAEHTGYVLRQEVRDLKHAAANGLAASHEALQAEALARTNLIPGNLRKPELFKGTEILPRSVAAAHQYAKEAYKYSGFVYTHRGISSRDYARLQDRIIPREVEGDGRCGVRAFAASMIGNKLIDEVPISKFFSAEAKVMGLEGLVRPPASYMATDYTMAGLAEYLRTSLCIIHYEGNPSLSSKAIRFYNNPKAEDRRVVYVLRIDDHYSAMMIDDDRMAALYVESAEDAYQIMCSEDPVPKEEEDDEPLPVEEKPAGGVEDGNTASEDAVVKRSSRRNRRGKKSKAVKTRSTDGLFSSPSESGNRSPDAQEYGSDPNSANFPGFPPLHEKPDIDDQLASWASKHYHISHQNNKVVRLATHGLHVPLDVSFVNNGTANTRWEHSHYLNRHKQHDDNGVYNNTMYSRSKGRFEWADALNSKITAAELVLAACCYDMSIVIFSAKRVRNTNTMTIDNYVEVHSSSIGELTSSVHRYLELDGLIYMPRMIPDMDGAIESFRDIRNFEYRTPFTDKHDALRVAQDVDSLGPIPLTHAAWEEAVKTELVRSGMRAKEYELNCDNEYFNSAFPNRGCGSEDPADSASHPLELLSCALLAAGLPDQASWVRTEGVEWLRSRIGWVPTLSTWYGIETATLLLMQLGLRTWQVKSPVGSIHTITEVQGKTENKTIPIIIGESTVSAIVIYGMNVPIPALESVASVQKLCNTHRVGGKFPEPPVEGPIMPPNKPVNTVQYASRVQAVLLGVGIGVTILGGLVAAYSFRRPLSGMVKHARVKLANRAMARERQRMMVEAVTGSSPLFNSEADPFLTTEWSTSGPSTPMQVLCSEVQTGQLPSPKTFGRIATESLRSIPIDDFDSGMEINPTLATRTSWVVTKLRTFFSGRGGVPIDHSDGL
ncbi:hypothetical protein [Leptosphaeria biglobosa botybirnavirus 1]|nr:hypothetical protein [Leptosphaeria biglobosa botybirnavirus 1]